MYALKVEPSKTPPRSELAKLIKEVMSQAIDASGKALALAGQLRPLLGRSYAHRTVSAWGRGDIMPPADVFLAAAKVSNISLDEKLGIGREPSEIEAQVITLQEKLLLQGDRISSL